MPADDGAKVLDLVTAGRWLGIGRSLSYRLAREGRFPVPVLQLGRRRVVSRAALENLLEMGSPAGQGGRHVSGDTPSKGEHHLG